MGMVKQSVTVGKQNIINIQMAADAINLDEVVAIGYGIAKKSDLTGAVASIKSEHLTNSKVGTVTTALQGLAAGVQHLSTRHWWKDITNRFRLSRKTSAFLSLDRKSTRLNSSHPLSSRMPSSA